MHRSRGPASVRMPYGATPRNRACSAPRLLHSLQQKRLIQRAGSDSYQFSHVLVELTAYHSMTLHDRAVLHERLAGRSLTKRPKGRWSFTIWSIITGGEPPNTSRRSTTRDRPPDDACRARRRGAAHTADESCLDVYAHTVVCRADTARCGISGREVPWWFESASMIHPRPHRDHMTTSIDRGQPVVRNQTAVGVRWYPLITGGIGFAFTRQRSPVRSQ